MPTQCTISFTAVQTHPTRRSLTDDQRRELTNSLWGQPLRIIDAIRELPDGLINEQVYRFAIGCCVELGLTRNEPYKTWDFDHVPNDIMEAYITLLKFESDLVVTVSIRDNIGWTEMEYTFFCS